MYLFPHASRRECLGPAAVLPLDANNSITSANVIFLYSWRTACNAAYSSEQRRIDQTSERAALLGIEIQTAVVDEDDSLLSDVDEPVKAIDIDLLAQHNDEELT